MERIRKTKLDVILWNTLNIDFMIFFFVNFIVLTFHKFCISNFCASFTLNLAGNINELCSTASQSVLEVNGTMFR